MSSPAETREAILEAAETLFARFGFRKTSIDDVARQARIGKGSVYLHFESKEALFAAVVGRVSDQMFGALVQAVNGARTGVAKLRGFIEARVTDVARLATEHHLDEEMVMEILPLANALREAHRAKELALLENVLREGKASGEFAVENPVRVALGLLTCLQGLEASAVRLRDQPDLRLAVSEMIEVFLRGLSPGRRTTTHRQ